MRSGPMGGGQAQWPDAVGIECPGRRNKLGLGCGRHGFWYGTHHLLCRDGFGGPTRQSCTASRTLRVAVHVHVDLAWHNKRIKGMWVGCPGRQLGGGETAGRSANLLCDCAPGDTRP
eukprot:scaffold3869_cov111-Isochrysis_galbana.AAC.2